MIDLCNRCGKGELKEHPPGSCPSKEIRSPELLRQKDPIQIEERITDYKRARLEEERKERIEYENMTAVEKRLKRLEEESKKRSKQREAEKKERLWSKITDNILREEEEDIISERMVRDEVRQDLERKIRLLGYQPDRISSEKLREEIIGYIENGEVKLERGRVKITPKGARRLEKNILKRFLSKKTMGGMSGYDSEELGPGAELSVVSRKYALGDEYYKINFEKTMLDALGRNISENAGKERIRLNLEDFQVYEALHQSKICFGLIIDESDSMKGEKIDAALETASALSELIRKRPQSLLKVYLFSQQVREIPYYEIPNLRISGGMTDIKAAMMAFRKGNCREKGDKQAYLITDAEPNTEGEKCLGFEAAAAGVVEEALRYRQAGITLNVIMLGENSRSQELASILEMKNLGRVFFTSPSQLGKIVIRAYLTKYKKV